MYTEYLVIHTMRMCTILKHVTINCNGASGMPWAKALTQADRQTDRQTMDSKEQNDYRICFGGSAHQGIIIFMCRKLFKSNFDTAHD